MSSLWVGGKLENLESGKLVFLLTSLLPGLSEVEG